MRGFSQIHETAPWDVPAQPSKIMAPIIDDQELFWRALYLPTAQNPRSAALHCVRYDPCEMAIFLVRWSLVMIRYRVS